MTLAARIRRLSVAFHERTILHDITLDIPAEGITVLLGRSGSGKTTFLRALNRLNECLPGCRTSGEAELRLGGELRPIYAGRTGEAALSDLRRRVGMVFQKPTPFPKTIFENVAYGLRVNGVKDENLITEKVELALRRAALWNEVEDRLSSSALGLSGGQQQRLCIARALAVEPQVLLMDEPASALDPIATRKVEESIVELKEGLTIIIVTHSMQQAARISDRTAFFYMGRLVESDSTDVIFTRPSQKETEDYITGRFG